MENLVDWLSHNSAASIAIIVAFSVVVITLTIIYTVAFFEGRAVSFWPPKIGARPAQSYDTTEMSPSPANSTLQVPLILDKGAALISARGQRYQIEGRIHSGATSALFAARSSATERVVLKVYWRGLNPNSSFWQEFQQEQQASEILRHRNIAKVIDRGLAGGYPFLVMEYFAGGTLRNWLTSHERLPGASVLSISTQIADAIDFAHSQGVLHRDLKPDNILFESDPTGRVAVSDFGIARLLGSIQRNITAGVPIVGSIDYIAPETLEVDELSESADIYAFGIMIFEMVAKRTPYEPTAEFAAVLLRKIAENAPDIRKFRDVPINLSARIAATLSRNPRERPSSARNVLAGIENDLLKL